MLQLFTKNVFSAIKKEMYQKTSWFVFNVKTKGFQDKMAVSWLSEIYITWPASQMTPYSLFAIWDATLPNSSEFGLSFWSTARPAHKMCIEIQERVYDVYDIWRSSHCASASALLSLWSFRLGIYKALCDNCWCKKKGLYKIHLMNQAGQSQ